MASGKERDSPDSRSASVKSKPGKRQKPEAAPLCWKSLAYQRKSGIAGRSTKKG